jgi:hypothetical protein
MYKWTVAAAENVSWLHLADLAIQLERLNFTLTWATEGNWVLLIEHANAGAVTLVRVKHADFCQRVVIEEYVDV